MNNKLTHIDYPLDMPYLLKLADHKRKEVLSYSDSRYIKSLDEWKVVKVQDFYLDKIMKDFGVNAKPRFYFHAPNYHLPMHTDNGTQCSLNFIIGSFEDMAPIIFEDGEIFYKQCLLNTQVKHSVLNKDKERILLKFSIFDRSYEDVVRTLKYVV
jgi:hypothetical protein